MRFWLIGPNTQQVKGLSLKFGRRSRNEDVVWRSLTRHSSHKEHVLTDLTQALSPQTRGRNRTTLALFGGSLVVAVILTGCTGGATPEPLPSGFPTSVPLISEQIQESDTMGAGWTVTVTVAGEDEQEAALAQLEKKGFVVIGESGADASDKTYSLANDEYSVRLGFGKTDAGYTVTYTIAGRVN